MRVAACLSGHTRNYKDNVPNFPFEVEYFISSCLESGLPSQNTNFFVSYHIQDKVNTDLVNVDDVVSIYNPKVWEFLSDKYIPDEMKRYDGIKTNHDGHLLHMGMMFYRIYRANLLKSQHERRYNFTYDFVIRSRFDVKVNAFDFNKNYMYFICAENKVVDLFFAGKSYIMDAISNCYLWFIEQDPEYLKSLNKAETILYQYVNQLNLDIPFLNTFSITFNKDYPHQHSIIKNGMVKTYNINGDLIADTEYAQ